jgi:phosphotriesterase-related protein
MTAVPSARGEIDSAELGKVLPHEHVRVRREDAMFQFPHLFDDDAAMDRALWNARVAMDHGVRTIFDPSVMGLGRDVRLIARFSELSGMNVVCVPRPAPALAPGCHSSRTAPRRIEAVSISRTYSNPKAST